MLLVKLITIYSDKDYFNYETHDEWVEVAGYTWQELIGHSDRMDEIAKKITDAEWDLEGWGDGDYEHNGEFKTHGHLWEMPSRQWVKDTYPCDKVIVGVSGSWVGLSEDKIKLYEELITLKDHEFSPFELRRFILRGEENE